MIKLLLVEDDASLRYIVQGGLEDMIGGYEVIAAANGEEGLKQWKEQHPDVIVSDIEMPVMNGYEMVKRIRETDGETPILFSSALISPKDVVKGYEIGANNYIKKPFIPEELDAHVHALLKLSKGEKSKDTSQCYKIGKEYVLDATHATLKHASGVNKTLTVRETGLLQMLCEKRGDVIRRGFIAGGALMGVASAAMRFGGINLVNDAWLQNTWSEVLALGAYAILIFYLIKASMKTK